MIITKLYLDDLQFLRLDVYLDPPHMMNSSHENYSDVVYPSNLYQDEG